MRARLITLLGAAAMLAGLVLAAGSAASKQNAVTGVAGLVPGGLPAGTESPERLGGIARDLATDAADALERVKGITSRPKSEGTDLPDRHRPAGPARAAQNARAAAASSVDIRDFSYQPRTITISVGDTVTWTNFDQAPHDADAFDGSFNTPVLDEGESASVSFDDAGSFRYFCSVHPPEDFPEFTGTVEVVAGGGNGDDGTGGGDSAQSSPPGGGDEPVSSDDAAGSQDPAGSDLDGTASGAQEANRSDSRLPDTGHEALRLALLGLMLLALGALARYVPWGHGQRARR